MFPCEVPKKGDACDCSANGIHGILSMRQILVPVAQLDRACAFCAPRWGVNTVPYACGTFLCIHDEGCAEKPVKHPALQNTLIIRIPY